MKYDFLDYYYYCKDNKLKRGDMESLRKFKNEVIKHQEITISDLEEECEVKEQKIDKALEYLRTHRYVDNRELMDILEGCDNSQENGFIVIPF